MEHTAGGGTRAIIAPVGFDPSQHWGKPAGGERRAAERKCLSGLLEWLR